VPPSFSKKQPEQVQFFLDRSLGSRVMPEVFREHGLSILVHDEMFAQDTPDEEWIGQVAENGLVAVTLDQRIARNPIQLHAVHVSGLRLITLLGGNVPAEKLALNFVNASQAIERFATQHQAPFIAKLSRPANDAALLAGGYGALTMYRSRDDLLQRFGAV